MNEDVILVDGSHGEGGGQIIRNSVTLACILRRSIKVIKIRANRPNPGLVVNITLIVVILIYILIVQVWPVNIWKVFLLC